VDADEYLKRLSRYIHLNPVRAKIVTNPSEFLWSSYPAFIGKIKAPDWLEEQDGCCRLLWSSAGRP